ncbi:MAG: TetR/AcrR family transcriptional regulator [Verrucomicrobiota bacterium]
MAPAKTTKQLILQSAIAILKQFGTEGLTMRKVAAEAEMSLGNLQYHFKDKTALMAGLAEHYFGECAMMLDEYQHDSDSPEDQLRDVILFSLDHVDHISDMCRIFREIWALSTRDHEIHEQLTEYYRITLNKLTALLIPLCRDEKSAIRLASLLMPYFEGYSITFQALPQKKQETAEMLLEVGKLVGGVKGT